MVYILINQTHYLPSRQTRSVESVGRRDHKLQTGLESNSTGIPVFSAISCANNSYTSNTKLDYFKFLQETVGVECDLQFAFQPAGLPSALETQYREMSAD